MNLRRIFNRIFRRRDSFEERAFWFAAILTAIVEAVCMTANLIIGMGTGLSIALGTAIVLDIVNGVFCYYTEKYIFCYSMFTLQLNLLVLPAAFLSGGGFLSGMPVFLAIGLLVCAFHPDIRGRCVTALIATAGYALLFWLSVRYPEIITPIPEDSFYRDMIISTLVGAVTVVLILNFVINEIQLIDEDHVREYEKKTRMRMELLESQAESIEDARRQRNEMRRHNMIITGFAEKGDADGLLEYLNQKQSVDEKYNGKEIFCMNGTINSILSIYARQAAKSRIPLEIRTDVEPEIPIKDPDLVTMVSNIVENAIAGAENSGSSEKRVSVDIHTRDGKLVILCRNTCNPRIDLSGGYPGHPGIGINIVEKLLQANGGLLKYEMDNGVIQCRLVINMGA